MTVIKYDLFDGRVRQTQLFSLRENPDEILLPHHEPALVAILLATTTATKATRKNN